MECISSGTCWSNFKLPQTSIFKELFISLNLSASESYWAINKSKLPKASAASGLTKLYLSFDFSDNLALTKAVKIPLSLHIERIFGQISVSKTITALGFHRSKNTLRQAGRSSGTYWCFTRAPILSRRIFDPVGVLVVTNISELLYVSKRLLTSGIEALTSPTETAWIHKTVFPSVGRLDPYPSLSPHLFK